MQIIAGHGDERNAESLHGGQQLQDFVGLSAGRKGEDHIAANHHSEVAVQGFGRMKKQCRTSGRGKRGRDLARDQSAFAHAGNHDPARATVKQFHCPFKVRQHRPRQTVS